MQAANNKEHFFVMITPASDQKVVSIIILLTLLHLPFLFLPPVNLEFAFADAAGYYATGQKEIIDQFFSHQANTLGFPFLIWFVGSIFHTSNYLLVARSLNLLGAVLYGVDTVGFVKYLNKERINMYLLLVLLNPLVWIYGGRALVDVMPAGLGLFSTSLLLTDRWSFKSAVGGGLLFGLAAILKYPTIALLLVMFLLSFGEAKNLRALSALSLFAIISMLPLAAYIVSTYTNFGFWFTPPNYQEVHTFRLQNLANNFSLYSGFLVLLSLPFPVLVVKRFRFSGKIILQGALLLSFLFLIGYFGLSETGETNLGALDRLINRETLNGLFLVLSAGVVSPLIIFSDDNGDSARKQQLIGIAILLILGVFSFARPAQRYLLPVLSLFIVSIPVYSLRWRQIIPIAVLFSVVNIYIGNASWGKGTAAQDIFQFIHKSGLLNRTDLGEVGLQVSNPLGKHSPNPDFIVLRGEQPGAVFSVKKGLPFASTSYSLVPLNAKP